MLLHSPTLLNQIAKRFSKPLSRIACSGFFYQAIRAIDAYLNFLQGKGSGTGWDLSNEIQAARKLIEREHPVVFDVGANVGEWSMQFLKLMPRAQLYMFEPAPECLKAIHNLNLPATVIPCAVGDICGTAQLHSSSPTDGCASLYPRQDSYFRNRTYTPMPVDLVTLDAIILRHNLDCIDFVKMDIEGNELAALHGAAEALRKRRIRALTFEFGSGNINSGTYFRDFWNLLNEAGFSLFRVTPGSQLLPIIAYYEDCEYFRGVTNYIAKLTD